jgi:hypothetical protein
MYCTVLYRKGCHKMTTSAIGYLGQFGQLIHDHLACPIINSYLSVPGLEPTIALEISTKFDHICERSR